MRGDDRPKADEVQLVHISSLSSRQGPRLSVPALVSSKVERTQWSSCTAPVPTPDVRLSGVTT